MGPEITAATVRVLRAAGSGEFMPDQDMALSVCKLTARASARIAKAAFEIARTRRRKVTAVLTE